MLKHRRICIFLVLFLWMSLLPSTALATEADSSTWNRVYEDFVLDGGYLRCGQNFGSSVEPIVMLHDMDSDNVPELLMTNGEDSRATRCAYIFTCEDGAVQYLNIGPTDAFCIEDSAYPGIWGGFNASPDWNWSYYSKTGSDINSELIYSEISSVGGNAIEQITEDSALFNESQREKRSIYGAAISEIRNIGWDTFIVNALGGIPGIEQSPDTELLKIASDLWNVQYNMIWTVPPGAWFQTEWTPNPLEYEGKLWLPVASSQVSSLADIQAYWENYFTRDFAPSEWYLQSYAEINGRLYSENMGIGGDMTLVGFEFDHIISRDDTMVKILVLEKRDDYLGTAQAGNIDIQEFVYTMVWEDSRWKCDDVTYTDGTPFLLRFGVQNVVGICTIPYDNSRDVDLNWSWELFNKDASVYDHNLAMAALILSRATYDGSNESMHRLQSLGFRDFCFSNYNNSVYVHEPGRSIAAQKITLNGKENVVICMAIRGTSNFLPDWTTNVSSLFSGFKDAATNVMTDLEKCIPDIESTCKCTLTKENTIFFLTGHSLGGAVSGLLANKCLQYANAGNIFTYTFASPNYDTERNDYASYHNVHNIIVKGDTVPNVPWGYKRYGHDWYYDLDDCNDELIELYSDGNLWWEQHFDGPRFYHDMKTYFACLLSGIPQNVGDGAVNPYSISSIHCPVDITVFDESGMEFGHTSGETVSLSNMGNVLIYTDRDAKYVLAPVDVKYTIQFTATGEGVMAYSQQVVDAFSGDTINSKDFVNVELADGKSMRADIESETDLENIHLFVLDESGKAIAEVAPDGTESSIGNGTPIIWITAVAIVLVGCAVTVILVIIRRKKQYASESSR